MSYGSTHTTHLLEGVRQPKDTRSYEGDEDVGENLNPTVCTVIVHGPDSTTSVTAIRISTTWQREY